MMTFELLRGTFMRPKLGPDGKHLRHPDGTPIDEKYHAPYRPSDEPVFIKSEVDLCAFNGRGVSGKFRRVIGPDEGTVIAMTWDPKKETLDDFYARMRAATASDTGSGQAKPPAAVQHQQPSGKR